MHKIRVLVVALSLCTLPIQAAEPNEALTRAEAAWARRADDHVGAQAKPEPIDEAITAFGEALAVDPGNLAIKARLLKALWFKGEHVNLDADTRLAVFEQGRDLAEETFTELLSDLPKGGSGATSGQIADALQTTDHAAEMYFWGAAHWGLWGRHRGKIASARQGVAGKIRDYGQVVLEIDENVEKAGAARILGRLHTEAPKLPFVTGWIDRDEAVRQLERAVALAPDSLLNRLYYLEALIEFDRSRRGEAIEKLRALAAEAPNTETVVEDLKILGEAKELLRRVDS